MTASYWIDTELGQWTPTIAGLQIPGIVLIDVKSSNDIDKKKPKGKDKASTTNNGQEPSSVTINITLANRRHWIDWQEFMPRLKPVGNGDKSAPLAIVHPDCELHGIRTIVVEEIDDSAPTARTGKTITIKASEWISKPKPAKVTVTPRQALATLGRGVSNFADSYVERVVEPTLEAFDAGANAIGNMVTGWFGL